jgi:serine/threonine protein kinase
MADPHAIGATHDELALLTLEDLTIGEVIGTGATCEVRLCRTKYTVSANGGAHGDATASGGGNTYALKIVNKASIVGQKQLDRIFREKAILADIHDRSVVRLYRTLQDEARLYLLLELAPGGELLWHLRRQRPPRLPVLVVRTIIAQLILVLSRLWASGIIYRDLKPTNVLFDANGALKLTDFGHAKRLSSPDERSTSHVGTPHYFSPEMVHGQPHGMAAQLWALGILIFEMLVGRPPFNYADCDSTELRRRIVQDQVPFGELDKVGAGPAVCDLIGLLLSKDERLRTSHFPQAYVDVRAHGWFFKFDWRRLEEGQLVAKGLAFGLHAAGLLGAEEERAQCNAGAGDDPFDDF